jgi:hypothetical protein
MNAIESFYRLAQQFPECNPKVIEFPSGAAMLDVIIRGEGYTAEFIPSRGVFGLTKTANATYGWEGLAESFETIAQLEARLIELVKF